MITPLSSPSLSWQESLLTHVTPIITVSLLKHLLYHPTNPMSVICASDGGATHTTAAFGWVICNGPRVLVQCYGPVHGFQPTAYQAECYGALLLLVYLSTLLSEPLPTTINIFIDNFSLCCCINQYQKRKFYSPTEATSPEQDILIQVESLMSHLNTNICFHHIKSHQDCDTPLSALSFAAQANCCADFLAIRGLSIAPSSNQTPTFDACKCQLHISNFTVTSHFLSTICHLIHLPAIWKYIITSCSWSCNEFIDWPVLGRLCLQNSHQLVFYLKWIHQLLPTGSILHKQSTLESPLCPAYDLLETNNHLLHCQHPSHCPHYISLMSNLRRSLRSYTTNPTLADILIDGIDSVFSCTTVQLAWYPAKFHVLITRQSCIGWINLL